MDAVSVQEAEFDVAQEYHSLLGGDVDAGAVVFFVGRVRSHNEHKDVTGLYLEHFPGMTESTIETIVERAKKRWPLQRARVIHRVGDLAVGEPIVFVGVSSAHRQAAFEAAEYIMDTLKTRAPLWKKERTTTGEVWLNARSNDQRLAQRWDQDPSDDDQ